MRPAPRRPGNNSTWSVIRAPAESTSQNTGVSCRNAYSVSRTIFSTVRAPHEPALTVGSFAITHTGRPSTRPTPVTTPSAGRSPVAAIALASSASSTNEPSSSSNASRSRTNSLPWAASFSRCASRLPARARSVALRSDSSFTSRTPDGEDGDVVGDGRRREVAGRFDQGLAQHVGIDARVASQEAGDALLAEQRLAVTRLRQPVGVGEQQVTFLQRDLAADVARLRIEEQQWPGRPQRLDLAVVPQPGRRVTGRREPQGAGFGVEHRDHQRDELLR